MQVGRLDSENTLGKHCNNIVLTVDIEDWFQVENLRCCFPIETWESCELRIENSTRALLDLFARHDVQATFFVLGWIAEKRPGLVREIHARGHEIASHGLDHQLVHQLSASALKKDLSLSKKLLEDIIEMPVVGYRAPSFSITPDLLSCLSEVGYQYDSSYNSSRLNGRYGKLDGILSKGTLVFPTNIFGITELPVSNLKLAGLTIPWGGGGYFRFLVPPVFEWGVSKILKKTSLYVFYCHPWEVDPGQPEVREVSLFNRFRHYVNLDKTLDRLTRFLSVFRDYRFVTCSQYLSALKLS